MTVKPFLMLGAAAASLALAACGTDRHVTDEDADSIDEQILGEADNSDPALTEALADQITVDPDLTDQSNRNAALPGDAVSGAPIPDTMHSVSDARAAMAEGHLLSVPAPTRASDDGRSAAAGGNHAGQPRRSPRHRYLRGLGQLWHAMGIDHAGRVHGLSACRAHRGCGL